MRVALTGTTGFIGRQVALRLLNEGIEVVALSRRPIPEEFAGHDGLKWFPYDLESDLTDYLVTALEGIDEVVHLAAYIPRDIVDPSEARRCLEANALGTLRLLVACEKAEIKRFVNASTGQLYAWSDSAVDERHPVDPSRRGVYYLTSKLVGECYVEQFERRGRVKTVILRLGSVYGPEMHCHATVYRLIETIIIGGHIQLANEGSYSVDMVYVDDVVNCIYRVLLSHATGTYNVGSGKATTFRELLDAVVSLCPGSALKVAHVSTSEVLGFAALDVTKARMDIGYEPLSLDQGLTRTIAAVRALRTESNLDVQSMA